MGIVGVLVAKGRGFVSLGRHLMQCTVKGSHGPRA
jgi:hypothetical protein